MHRLFLVVAALVATTASAANITTTTCTPTVQTGCVFLPLSSYTNIGSVSVQVTGTWAGTLVFEGSNDASTYVLLRAYPIPDHNAETVYVTSTTGNGAWSADPAGLIYFRVRATSLSSGTAVVSVQPSTALPTTGAVALNSPDGGIYMTLGSQRVAVEATGPGGADVAIAGTVDLGSATLANLNPPRTRRDWRGMPIDGGVTAVPYALPDGGSGPLADRTEISISYAASGGTARCGCPEVGDPLPSCAAAPSQYAGVTLNSGKTVTWTELKSGTVCYCVGCGLTGTDTRQIEVLEGGNAP